MATSTAPTTPGHKCHEGTYISETKEISWDRFLYVMNATTDKYVGFMTFSSYKGLQVYNIDGTRIVTLTEALLDGFGGSRFCAKVLDYLGVPASLFEEINEAVKSRSSYLLMVSRKRATKNAFFTAPLRPSKSNPGWTWHFVN